ncbi:MAG: class I SAM-dependent methyltransferase [Syntrophobacteraceae bacterium]
MLDIMRHPIAFSKPRRVSQSAWVEHIPFAFAIMDLHRPGIFVELGTHTGVSYCAFCQAATELMLPAKCYAVDTWKGDEHAGFYSDAVFAELNGYHGAYYWHFSNLMRMTFDEASGYFADGTIDLLHIDGFHLYDEVRHDFDTWLPKMSSRGVVLLHDSFARERDFGVGLLLEELRARYPVFEFTHGNGLAVVGVGPMLASEPVFDLFRVDGRETVAIRTLFSSLGARISSETALDDLIAERNATVAERDAKIAECNATIAERDAKIARLRKQRQLFTYIIISIAAVFSLISLFMLGYHNWF